jgi:hypothetical protein
MAPIEKRLQEAPGRLTSVEYVAKEGGVSPQIALDSNVLSYLVEAMATGYDPKEDNHAALRDQRVAAFRIFLYVGNLFVTPTAHREAETISDQARRSYHEAVKNILLSELVGLDEDRVEARAEALLGFHPHESDCRIVAEAELGGLTHLLTFDAKMFARLEGETRVELTTASEFWTRIDLPRGSRPRWEPRSDNPLSTVDWWHW